MLAASDRLDRRRDIFALHMVNEGRRRSADLIIVQSVPGRDPSQSCSLERWASVARGASP